MIGKLKGLIDSYGEDYVILDVGGVGYQVHCSSRTLQALPAPGEAAVLSIETYVREDQIKLFGFRTDQEREWFRLLQTVQGVGAKVALAVLVDFRPEESAVEQTFVNKDGVATLKLGQARGVAMLAPAMFGIAVAEYAPNQVKKTVVGAGHADKNQILAMLKILLPKAEPKSPDAADALAIAVTHAHHRQSATLRMRSRLRSHMHTTGRASTCG